MSRESNNDVASDGRLLNGYDYRCQCWVKDGAYLPCGHALSMACSCYGRTHAGDLTVAPIMGGLRFTGRNGKAFPS